MISRPQLKTIFDGSSTTLIAIGSIGLYIAINDNNYIPGIFGIISIILGLTTMFARHTWNERKTNKKILKKEKISVGGKI